MGRRHWKDYLENNLLVIYTYYRQVINILNTKIIFGWKDFYDADILKVIFTFRITIPPNFCLCSLNPPFYKLEKKSWKKKTKIYTSKSISISLINLKF